MHPKCIKYLDAHISSQEGKRFLITGSSSGIGLECAKALLYKGAEVTFMVRNEAKAKALAERTGAAVTDAVDIAANSRIVFLAVKPNIIENVVRELRFAPGTLLVTMAAGKTIAEIAAAAGTDKVIRIMPNTPAAVGKGLTVYCRAAGVTAEDEALFLEAMACAGRTDRLAA